MGKERMGTRQRLLKQWSVVIPWPLWLCLICLHLPHVVKVDEEEEEEESKQSRPQAPPMRGYNRYDQEKFKPKEGVPLPLVPLRCVPLPLLRAVKSILCLSLLPSGHYIQDRREGIQRSSGQQGARWSGDTEPRGSSAECHHHHHQG